MSHGRSVEGPVPPLGGVAPFCYTGSMEITYGPFVDDQGRRRQFPLSTPYTVDWISLVQDVVVPTYPCSYSHDAVAGRICDRCFDRRIAMLDEVGDWAKDNGLIWDRVSRFTCLDGWCTIVKGTDEVARFDWVDVPDRTYEGSVYCMFTVPVSTPPPSWVYEASEAGVAP